MLEKELEEKVKKKKRKNFYVPIVVNVMKQK